MSENFNARRWNIIASLSRKNLTLSQQLLKHSDTIQDPEKKQHMKRLSKKLAACASMSLLAVSQQRGTEGITAYYCQDKVCFVCNSQRSRSTRRKYVKWFQENQFLYDIFINGKLKTVTRYQLDKNYPDCDVLNQVAYDIMHLVLTVPHSKEHGWKGTQLYYSQIQDAFKEMRRLKFWKTQVLGGEYGIETAQKNSGNHIHLHVLAFVRSALKNRDRLHRDILLNWNRLTVDPNNKRQPFNSYQVEAIMKGNKTLTQQDVSLLDPSGATFISLSTIYSKDKRTGLKTRSFEWGDKKFIKAVMEAIKYHFEPLFFDKENKQFDLDLMADIKPVLYGRPLYEKFGCLRGESSLNLTADITEEYDEVSSEVDQDTGEIIQRDHYIVNPRFLYSDKEKIIWSRRAVETARKLPAGSTRQAIQFLSGLIKTAGKTGQL